MTNTTYTEPTDKALDTLRAMRTRYGTALAATFIDTSELMVVEHAKLNIRMAIDRDGFVDSDLVWSFRARGFVAGEEL